MNINKIIKEGNVIRNGKVVKLIFKYPHMKVTGYDMRGRVIRKVEMMEQTSIGMTLSEARTHAKNFLLVEKADSISQARPEKHSEIYYTIQREGAIR